MRIRLWEPARGWREFFGEVVIVVLGVLLALAAGQVVDTIHGRIVAADTRRSPTN